MDEVSGWVFTICAGTLVCGIVSALVPSKSFEKAIQLLLGIFMLCCFLTPISADWQLPTASDISQAEQRRLEVAGQAEASLGSQLQAELAVKAKQLLQELLLQHGLEGTDTPPEVTAQPDGSLLLTVTLPQTARPYAEELQAQLAAELGATVSVRYPDATPQ